MSCFAAILAAEKPQIMRRSTFNATFQCSPSKVRRNGEAPIELVLCINGKRTLIQLPKKCNPAEFLKLRTAKKDNDIKTYCTDILAKVNFIQTTMTVAGEPMTAQRVKDYFRFGASHPSYPISQMYSDYVDVHARSASVGTMYKYKKTYERFLAISGHKGTDEAGDVTYKDIEKFKAQIEATLMPNTVTKELKNLKAFFSLAHNSGFIKANPASRTKITAPNRETVYLTVDEIRRIREVKMVHHSYENVRDQFLFLCFTGLEYADLLALKPEDVHKEDGELCITKKRVKDNVPYTTFLHEDAKSIWEQCGGVFHLIQNQTFNRYLKKIGEQAKIHKSLTSNVGRHTFATYMLSVHHIQIETLSKMLGHTNIKQTQYYAKLLDSTVINDNLKVLKAKHKPVPKKFSQKTLNTKRSSGPNSPCGYSGPGLLSPAPKRVSSNQFFMGRDYPHENCLSSSQMPE
jgi:site-specific recombinase XerD